MSITTYAELKTAVASWLHRTDLTANIPDFIRMAEEAIESDLLGSSILDTTDDAVSLSSSASTATLPSDCSIVLSVRMGDTGETLVPATSMEILDYMTSARTGRPTYWAVRGQSALTAPVLEFDTYADQAYTLSVTYTARLPAMDNDGDTTHLLTVSPGLYLYGSLVQAARFMKDLAMEDRYMRGYEQARGRIMTVNRPAPAALRMDGGMSSRGSFDINLG